MKTLKKNMGSIDFVLFSTVMLLVAIGCVMVYSASSYTALYGPTHDDMYFLKKQAIAAVIGVILMFIIIKFDYHRIKGRLTLIIMGVTTVLLLFALKSIAIKGASRWISIGPFQLQPSEMAKYVIVLYAAKSMDGKGEKMNSFLYGVFPYILVSGFYAGLVLGEHSLSIAAVIMIVTIIMLFAGGVKMKHLLMIIVPIFAAGVFAILLEPYRLARFTNFTNPWKSAKTDGYQLIQSFLALGSGGVSGLGLGMSRQKRFYIPEPHNDFIFSIIGEELGFIGCIFIIILFCILIWRGIRIAVMARDMYGTILAVGITSVIAVQAVINIAVVTGSMPVTGVTLPFISYGGSSILFNLASMGLLLNISRQTSKNY